MEGLNPGGGLNRRGHDGDRPEEQGAQQGETVLDSGQVGRGGRAGTDSGDGDPTPLQVRGHIHRADRQGGVEEREANDQTEKHQRIDPRGAAVGAQETGDLNQGRVLAEVGDLQGQEDHRRGKDDRHHAAGIELQRQIALTGGDPRSTDLALGADDGDAAAALLDADDANDGDQEDRHQNNDAADGLTATGLGQLNGGAQSPRQGRDDVQIDDQGRPLANTALGDDLTEPHHHHRTGHQGNRRLGDEDQVRRPGQRVGPEDQGKDDALKETPGQGDIAGVLGNLAAARLSLVLLQILQLGQGRSQQLNDDRGVDEGKDPQGKDTEGGDAAAGEDIEEAQQGTALSRERLEGCAVNPRHGDIDAQAHQEQKPQGDENPVAQVLGLNQLREDFTGTGVTPPADDHGGC